PPVREDENDYVQSELVTEMMKEFDIDALTDQESIVLNSFPENSFVDAILSASNNNNNSNMFMNNNSAVPMETDTVVDDESDIIKTKQKRKRPLAKDDGPALTAAERAIEGNWQKSREQRMLLKKKKKSRRRLDEKWNTFHFHTVKSAAMGGVWVIELLTATNCQSGWAERGTFVASALVALSVLSFIQQKNTCRLSVCGRLTSTDSLVRMHACIC
ncbi:hypothetical protein D917_06950, partial [Trichinella nativa]